LSCDKGVTGGKDVELMPQLGRIPEQRCPELASMDSSQILIIDYQLTKLLVADVEGH